MEFSVGRSGIGAWIADRSNRVWPLGGVDHRTWTERFEPGWSFSGCRTGLGAALRQVRAVAGRAHARTRAVAVERDGDVGHGPIACFGVRRRTRTRWPVVQHGQIRGSAGPGGLAARSAASSVFPA